MEGEGERGSDEIEREIVERETKGEREKEGVIISKERGEGERERVRRWMRLKEGERVRERNREGGRGR